jgi:hypothetical protein
VPRRSFVTTGLQPVDLSLYYDTSERRETDLETVTYISGVRMDVVGLRPSMVTRTRSSRHNQRQAELTSAAWRVPQRLRGFKISCG